MSYNTYPTTSAHYTGKFFREIFSNKDTGYCVYLYNNGKDVTTVVGTELPKADYPVTFSGRWIQHKDYGMQFEAEMVVEQVPTSREDIITFVAKMKIGIGRRRVQRMLEIVPEAKFWDTVQQAPETFESVVNEDCMTRLQQRVKRLLFMQELARVCGADIRIDIARYKQICSVFKDQLDEIVELIKENPFILVLAGFTFSELDAFNTKRSHIPANDHRRLLGACMSVLLEGINQCHSCLPLNYVVEQMVGLLKERGPINAQTCADFLKHADAQQDITICCGMCYLNRSFEEESTLVNILTELNAIPPSDLNPNLFMGFIQDYEKEKGFCLSEDQKNAVWTAMTRSICIITGGPGTGKSTILDAIRACWKSFRPSEQFSLMAPTGRAAVRMTEVTNEYASTVHSRLQLNIGNDSMNHMIANDAYVTDELVIVDETSMLDQPTSSALVAALKGRFENKTRQHLILVGDPDQLPSVAYGNVLADIIESGVIPVCSLSTVYRQAADNPIIENSIRIKNGNPDLLWTPTFKAFHNGSELANKVAVRKFFSACVKQYGIENVTLLSPYRQKTDISTNALNLELQDAINPDVGQPAIQYGKRQYRLHDWVMMLKNTESLSNGDIGQIIEVVNETADQEAGVIVQFESGVKELFTKENLSRLDLAYALTVHKSQGGQYRVVIMILPDKPSKFLQRRVIYTGVPRAKEYFAVFGPRHVLSYAIRNDKYDKRFTGLVIRLRNSNESIALAA